MAHGGDGAPAKFRRRRGEHRVERDEANPEMCSKVAGLHRTRRKKSKNAAWNTKEKLRLRPREEEWGLDIFGVE